MQTVENGAEILQQLAGVLGVKDQMSRVLFENLSVGVGCTRSI